MTKVKIAIVEDKIKFQELISTMLNKNYSKGKIVGTADSVDSAVNLITDTHPDLVLMDIELIGGTGFDVLSMTNHLEYSVIFITAYEEYAIDAIRASACDYLLKPIQDEDLLKALARYEENRSRFEKKNDQKILLNGIHRTIQVPSTEILYIEVKKGRCCFHLEDNRVFNTLKPINSYKEVLDQSFYQVHRKCIVNINKVISLEDKRGGDVIMVNGVRIKIAYRRRQGLKSALLKQSSE